MWPAPLSPNTCHPPYTLVLLPLGLWLSLSLEGSFKVEQFEEAAGALNCVLPRDVGEP